jgi:predicted esterase
MNILESKGRHIYTLILLHGMYKNHESLLETSKYIQERLNNVKIILPDAPKITVNWPTGDEYNISSWYNYYTRKDGLMDYDEIDKKDFNKQIKRISKLIKDEIDILKGKSERIILGGISQGGTIALHVALTLPFKIKSVLGIHTLFLKDMIKNYEKLNDIPIYLFSGRNDKIYNIKLQEQSNDILLKNNYLIKWHIENNLQHCEYSEKEIEFIINSIISIK